LLVAELLRDHDGAFEGDLIVVHGCAQPNMLRAYADANRSSHARTEIEKPRSRKPELQSRAGQQKMVGFRRHVDGNEIHRRRADEARHEPVGGSAVEFERRPHLLHDALLHDHDPVAQRHRFGLVVGDEDRGRRNSQSQLLELEPHLCPQLRVEVR
jgi:hypothetical protein